MHTGDCERLIGLLQDPILTNILGPIQTASHPVPRHIRKAAREYADRRARIVEALDHALARWLELVPSAAADQNKLTQGRRPATCRRLSPPQSSKAARYFRASGAQAVRSPLTGAQNSTIARGHHQGCRPCCYGRPSSALRCSSRDVLPPSLLPRPCRSSRLAAISMPLELNQGPRPIRSRALTAAPADVAVVLRYARHSRFREPAAVASFRQWASAPARPPRFPPSPVRTLVTKKLISRPKPQAVRPTTRTPIAEMRQALRIMIGSATETYRDRAQ